MVLLYWHPRVPFKLIIRMLSTIEPWASWFSMGPYGADKLWECHIGQPVKAEGRPGLSQDLPRGFCLSFLPAHCRNVLVLMVELLGLNLIIVMHSRPAPHALRLETPHLLWFGAIWTKINLTWLKHWVTFLSPWTNATTTTNNNRLKKMLKRAQLDFACFNLR